MRYLSTHPFVAICLAIGVTLLAVQHWSHLPLIVPWLFILACPLMHVFMHGGHHHDRPPMKNNSDGLS
jgi:hypothetical protein